MPVNPIMKNVKHVVVLMLENRGFDHFMGWLYDGQNKPRARFPAPGKIPQNQSRLREFEGLDGLEEALPGAVMNPYTIKDRNGRVVHQGSMFPAKGARSPKMPAVNPLEDFVHIFEQMYGAPHAQMAAKSTREALVKIRGQGGKSAYKRPPMNGYVQSFAHAIEEHAKKTDFTQAELSEILDTYTPEQLPVLAGLARHYAISDLWFCSVPSQTNTNRAFSIAGTARGLVTNNFYDPKGHHADSLPKGTRTLFHLLEEAGVDWGYFWSKKWPPVIGNVYGRNLFPDFLDKKYDANFPGIAEFYKRAYAGTLPAVTFLEPEWGGGKAWVAPSRSIADQRLVGNEFHPVCDTTVGEFFVKKVYDHLTKLADGRPNPKWSETLLLITFDENGGTYDHFPPPAAPPTGRDDAPPSHVNADLDPDTRTQFGFEFDLYGVRVPTLIISPHVAPGTVFRSPTEVPFDHASIISTILKWKNISTPSWNRLGNRVVNAPTFDEVLTLNNPRTDIKFGTAPARGQGARPLAYGQDVHLRFVGDRWGNPVSKYIVAAERSGAWWYPKVGDRKQDAVKLQLKGASGRVKNGAMVQITNPAMYRIQGNVMSSPTTGHNVYYSTLGQGGNWQIWLVSNRDEGEEIYEGDEVILLSQIMIQRPIFDPYQRLIVDRTNQGYLTTEAGEWAVWQIEKA